MIYFVIGTEAELIKMFPLILESHKNRLPYKLIATGQHVISKSVIFPLFGLRQPDVTLYTGPEFTSMLKMLVWFFSTIWRTFRQRRKIFSDRANSITFVHGDTVSTLLGTIVSRMAKVKVAHVEAGLRSFNIFHPFPEEITRRLVSRVADWHFCPGEWAFGNLPKGLKKFNTDQNTLFDSLTLIKKKFRHVVSPKLPKRYSIFIYHRTENHLNKVFTNSIVDLVVERAAFEPVVFIMHHTTENALRKAGHFSRLEKSPGVIILPRQSYPVFMKILSGARCIATDGGSNQEECYYLGIPTLLLRKTTERREGLGDNVVLSKLDIKVIRQFYANIEIYRKSPARIVAHPSKKIIGILSATNSIVG